MANSIVAAEKQHVIMGAGEWFVKAYDEGEVDCEAICVDENYAGETQGGATVEYTPSTYTIEDDNGRLRRTFMVKADATMKTGMLTIDVKSIGSLMSVGVLTVNDQGTKRILKLGSGHAELKRFFVVFRYVKDKEKKQYIYVGMVATNTAPLTLAFTKDKETVQDLTYTADTNGVDDTILVIEEDIEPAAEPAAEPADGGDATF